MNRQRVVGIDPGITGAIALIERDRGFTSLVEVIDMPTIASGKGAKSSERSKVDVWGLSRFLRDCMPADVWVEQVAPMPSGGRSMGATSAFRFGEAFACAWAIPAVLTMPVHMVTPVLWKKSMGIAPKSGKDASRLMVLERFPGRSGDFARKKDHGRADAVLIALYGLGATHGSL